MSRFARCLVAFAAVAALVAALVAVPAGAARVQRVRCVGTADYCGVTLNIGGGVTNRTFTVMLTDTNLGLVGENAIPGKSRRGFTITNASFRSGGSQYRFTLNALRSNPPGARLVLLFAAGGTTGRSDLGGGGLKSGTWRAATAIFDVGAGMTVSIVGGGGGTSNCTTDETNTTFVTKGDDERHEFGFNSKGSGSCFWQVSWSDFRFTVKDPTGKQVGTGVLSMDQNNAAASYYLNCTSRFDSEAKRWRGINCTVVGDPYNKVVRIERIY
jgi:hypothetical protein